MTGAESLEFRFISNHTQPCTGQWPSAGTSASTLSYTLFLPCLKSVVLRSISSVSSSLTTSGTAVLEDVTSGRNAVVMVVVVVVPVAAVVAIVVIFGGVSGNLEVDVPVSERPVVL